MSKCLYAYLQLGLRNFGRVSFLPVKKKTTGNFLEVKFRKKNRIKTRQQVQVSHLSFTLKIYLWKNNEWREAKNGAHLHSFFYIFLVEFYFGKIFKRPPHPPFVMRSASNFESVNEFAFRNFTRSAPSDAFIFKKKTMSL